MNKTQKKLRCKEILQRNNITNEEQEFLKELLKDHPHYENKKGIGINYIFTTTNIYNNNSFYIMRDDGTTTDFSYYQCIQPRTTKSKISAACRHAVKDFVMNQRTKENTHIHHKELSFSKIVEDWLRENTEIDLTIKESKDMQEHIEFKNKDTIKSFYNFHKHRALLEEIEVSKHVDIHRKK